MKSEDSGTRASTPTITEEQDWTAKDSDGLLASEDNQTNRNERSRHKFQRPVSLRIHFIIFSIYICTLLAMGILLAKNWTYSKKPFLYSPANDAVEYYVGEFSDSNDPHGKYVGEPRPSLEKAWEDLLGPMNVRLSLDDVRAFGREATAVGMSDGGGYLGTLNVYHELHCVRWLHKYIYEDEYWPGIDDEQRAKNKYHSNHCLNTLKSFAMCHADVGLVIYSWQQDRLKPGANGTGHTCANWDKVAQWTRERTVDMYKPGLIVHPSLGPAYPAGNEDTEHIHGALHEHGRK